MWVLQNESDRFNATSDFEIISGFDSNLNTQRGHRVYKYFLPVSKVGATMPISYNSGARDMLEYIASNRVKKRRIYRHFTNLKESISQKFNTSWKKDYSISAVKSLYKKMIPYKFSI